MKDFSGCIPPISNWRLTNLPKFMEPNDVKRLQKACDRKTAKGQRDYALLLLIARLGLRADGSLLLWIGSMGAVKATERLLYAAARLTTEFPELSVALVGDGPRRAFLEQVVAGTPALTGRVRFAGPVNHDELPDWYRAASLSVLPSRSEGVPNVLLEAMTCGIPFVASDVGSISDLLPYGPSAVVPEGDIAALTAAIAAALRGLSTTIAPRPFDRLDGARHLLHHLGLDRGAP